MEQLGSAVRPRLVGTDAGERERSPELDVVPRATAGRFEAMDHVLDHPTVAINVVLRVAGATGEALRGDVAGASALPGRADRARDPEVPQDRVVRLAEQHVRGLDVGVD